MKQRKNPVSQWKRGDRVNGMESILSAGSAGEAFRGILAVNPGAAELLVIGRHNHTARVAALPADDLIGLAALLAALLQTSCPAGVGRDRLALLGIPEQGSAFTVTLDAHVHRGEGGGAQLGGAERFAVSISDALEEILPQGFRVVAGQAAGDELPLHVLQPLGQSRAALHSLRQNLEAEL